MKILALVGALLLAIMSAIMLSQDQGSFVTVAGDVDQVADRTGPRSSSGGLELRLTTQLPERLPYLYEDRELTLVNESRDVVLLPENAFRVRTFIEHDGEWLECRPRVLADEMPLGEVEWKEIASGEVVSLALPASRCLCKGGRSRGCDEWTVLPGTHRLKVALETRTYDAEVPGGGFVGVLKSNVMEIRITEPTGVEAQVIAWAKGSPMKVEVLREFPTSEYAAFLIYGYSARIDKVDPEKMRSLVDRGVYPSATSVPDHDGWRSLGKEGVARWQVEWGQRILREHPDFPFRDEIRVSIALAQMALGEKQDARASIEEIAETGKPRVARWVRKFLEQSPEPN